MKFPESTYIERPSNVIEVGFDMLRFLCENARADEVQQYEAIYRKKWNAVDVAIEFYQQGIVAMGVIGADGIPVAAGGYCLVTDKVWQAWMVGTQAGWDTEWRTIHRATRWLTEALVDTGNAQRLQVSTLASRTGAMEWYERLGYSLEGISKCYGANGEDVAHYGRVIGLGESE